MSIRFGKALGWDYWRAWIVGRTHWTLEYVDALDWIEAQQLINIWQHADMARAHEQRKAERHGAARGKARGRRR